MDKNLIDLKNGAIKSIDYDTWSAPGCDTCDYGSRYVNEYDFVLSKGTLHIEVNNMYEYAFSEGDMMKILLSNIEEIKELTESEFVNWIIYEIKESSADDVVYSHKVNLNES